MTAGLGVLPPDPPLLTSPDRRLLRDARRPEDRLQMETAVMQDAGAAEVIEKDERRPAFDRTGRPSRTAVGDTAA